MGQIQLHLHLYSHIRSNFYFLVVLCVFSNCKEPDVFPTLEVIDIPVPTLSSGESRLTADAKGVPYLSWVEYLDNDTVELRYAMLQDDDSWSAPRSIASGVDWFTNWADFPSLSIYDDGSMAAHWLQMRDTGTYDYDVCISQSMDGMSWSPSFVIHRDSISAEHGFATLLPAGDKMIASWLDGRNTKLEEKSLNDKESSDDHSHGHGGGAMTLRTATFDIDGQLSHEYQLDDRICDCCQTDMALTSTGAVVVYRDRSPQEVRDISIVRQINNEWTEPKSIYNDRWEIHGCPVNGPAVTAKDQDVYVAWYTAAEGIPKVQVAISTDGGANFDLPIYINDAEPLGRVDIQMYRDDMAIISWLENTEESAVIKARFVTRDGTSSGSQNLIETSRARKSGFPIMISVEGHLYMTWTAVENDQTVVRAARLGPNRRG